MVEEITILGAGHGGHAVAADLALGGFKVNIFELPEFEKNLEPIIACGGIEVSGSAREGSAKLNKITTDIKEAIEDAEVIISAVVATAHKRIAELCAPHLRDGQTVMLWGKGGGTLVFQKILRELRVKKELLLGETNSFPYGCRVIGPAKVNVLSPLKKKTLLAALPAVRTEDLLKVANEIYADRPNFLVPGENVLESMMLDYNAIEHPPVTICNAGRIEYFKGDFPHWGEGYTRSVERLEEALEKERSAIVKALQLSGASTMSTLAREWMKPGGLLTTVKAPPTFESRYILEDIPCGLVTFSSIGDMLGVSTPVMKAVITVAAAMLGKESDSFWKEGRTVKELGIAGMSVEEIHRFVKTGTTPPNP